MSGGVSKLERYIYFLLFIPAYLFVRRARVEVAGAYLVGAVVGALVMLCQAVYQTQIEGIWAAKGAYHKIIFGDTSILLSVIIGCAMLALKGKWWQYILGAGAVIFGMVSSALSTGRGAWVFLPVSIISVIILYWRDIGRKGWGGYSRSSYTHSGGEFCLAAQNYIRRN